MESVPLQPEIFVAALALYAVIVAAVTLANAREARRSLGGLDEAGPGAHVLHEGRAQALVGQVFGADR